MSAVGRDELVSLIDKAQEDVKSATGTFSDTIRAIGIGLSLLFYSVALAENSLGIVAAHGRWLVLASFFGVLCLVSDVLQYLFIWRQKKKLLDYMRETLDAGRTVTAAGLEAANRNWQSRARDAAFYAKAVFAALGCVVVIYVLVQIAAPLFCPPTTP